MMQRRKPRQSFCDVLEPRRLFAALTPGLSVTGTISSAAEVDSDTISVKAGQTLMVALGETSSSSFTPQIQVRDPNGAAVRTNSGATGVFITLTATLTGTYTLRVSDATSSHTGSYQLTAFTPSGNFSHGEDAFEAESGRRRAATIGPGDLDVWTVTTTAGQFISAEVAKNTTNENLNLGMIMFAPDGSIAGQKTSTSGLSIDVANTLTKTGVYFVVVYEPDADVSGVYGITFGRLPGPQATEDPDTNVPLPNNTLRNGMLPAGDYDIFSVYIDQGANISATVHETSGNLQPEIQFFNPDGSLVTTNTGSISTSIGDVAPVSGNYWIVVRDRTSAGGGNYSIQYTLSIDNSTPAIQNNILTINGTSGADTITLSETTHAGIAAIDVNLNGKDTFYDKSEVQRINLMAGAGNDRVTDTTSINSYIFGDIGNDVLQGGSGNDTLTGAGGKNILFGGAGDDRLNGSSGFDQLSGEAGNDRLYGNAGNDILNGGPGTDHLLGGDGDDALLGGTSNDHLMGEGGNDTLSGGTGADVLDGGAGIDTRGDKDSTDTLISIEK
jgi:Ca2+-binding RTX toxin-like protein